MLAKRKRNGKVRVRFTMPSMDGCDCLYLVGDFNEWSETAHPMQRVDDGAWSLTLELEPGRDYQYRYRTDIGVWHNDPTADAYVPNPYGSDNSVVRT